MSETTAAILSYMKAELDALEEFAATDKFELLLDEVRPHASNPELWLLEWLLRPPLVDELPSLTLAQHPGGVARLKEQLRRTIHGMCA